jgi:hypothetical protein
MKDFLFDCLTACLFFSPVIILYLFRFIVDEKVIFGLVLLLGGIGGFASGKAREYRVNKQKIYNNTKLQEKQEDKK